MNLLSTEGFEQEPEVYELEIMQPPTRDDWITDIREAVDAASPGKEITRNLGTKTPLNEILRYRNACINIWCTKLG